MKRIRFLIVNMLCWLLIGFHHTSLANEAPFVETRTLSASMANKAVSAAYEDCSKRGFHVAVALTARDGNLMAFIRSPLAGPHTVQVSQRKAYTAATYQASTLSMVSRDELKEPEQVLVEQTAS